MEVPDGKGGTREANEEEVRINLALHQVEKDNGTGFLVAATPNSPHGEVVLVACSEEAQLGATLSKEELSNLLNALMDAKTDKAFCKFIKA